MRLVSNGLCVFALVAGTSCGAPPPPPPAAPVPMAAGDEPSFVIAGFEALEEASTASTLPYFSTAGGRPSETPCIAALKDKDAVVWDTANPDVVGSIEANVLPIKAGILRWVVTALAREEDRSVVSAWQLDIDELTVRHLTGDRVRLDAAQQCFADGSMMLPAGARVVTTLFGAKKILVRSSIPMDKALVNQMKARAKKQNLQLSSVMTYKRATDEKGRPLFRKGKPLFVAPSGLQVLQKDVPPVAKRPVYELVVRIPSGLHFAFGWMPASHWKMENVKGQCNLNLIYDDLTPRVPECPQITNVGFGVSEGDDPSKEVIVKVSADAALAQKVVPFDTTALIAVGGRYLVWVTPRRLELGADLEIDAVMLNPSNDREELLPFKYGR